MNEDNPRSRRLVLLGEADEDTVEEFAAGLRWPRLSESAADLDEFLPRQVSWAVRASATLHYMEDLISDLKYVMVIADDQETVCSAVAEIEDGLPVWTVEGLLADVDAQTDPDDVALALIRLGMGAPLEYNDRVFERIRDAMGSEAKRVREGALWAITYEAWPAYASPVRALLAQERDEDLVRTAQGLLAEMSGGDQP
jgi:hypothetical protein